MEETYKEVYFDQYCKTCEHKDVKDEKDEEPCDECLSYPTNLYSHKPISYEENTKKIKGDKQI